jgi:hypothetical protein
MQIPPSTSLLHALSRPVDTATAPAHRKAPGNEAARAAARAVFAQINATPAVSGQAGGVPPAPAAAKPATALPAVAPTKPLARGSIVNILV